MILYLVISLVLAFMYELIKHKRNERLVQWIDLLTIKPVHDITEIPKDRN